MRRTLLTLIAALVAAAVLLAGCASPQPDALPRLGAIATGLPLAVTSDFPDARWWQALGNPTLDALVDRALSDQPGFGPPPAPAWPAPAPDWPACRPGRARRPA